jgi:hypothetical protein
MRNISIPQPALDFDVIGDTRETFTNSLKALMGEDVAKLYLLDEHHLPEHNRDHTGNRNAILGWWMRRAGQAQLILDTRAAILSALAENDEIKFVWDCDLKANDQRTYAVEFRLEIDDQPVTGNGKPVVRFRTKFRKYQDHADGPVEHRAQFKDVPRGDTDQDPDWVTQVGPPPTG